MIAATLQLTKLHPVECAALLRSKQLGRISAVHEGWPSIWAVNYTFHDGNILIRSDRGRKLTHTTLNAVAFEVDDADADAGWGWSVLVQGPAYDITYDPDPEIAALRALCAETWAPGVKDHVLQIRAVWVTGRAYGPCPALDI